MNKNLLNKYDDLIKDWHEKKIYNFIHGSQNYQDNTKNPTNFESSKNIFSIDTPPPTISGVLHMGHIFSYCHTDFIARYMRMIGKNVFYPIGYDCNGLPTEKLVEKQFNKRAKDYETIVDFENNCQKVIESSIPQFRNLFEKIGLSIDYNLQYHTMDERCRKVAQASFESLKKKGLLYQAYKPVFWDWIDGTAISQAEIEDREFEGEMHNLVFKTENGEEVIISTTRPEMLFSCFCIFVHPDDLELGARYNYLNNKTLLTPIYNKRVPILPDSEVLKDKGTGVMMCCGFGDELDLRRYEKYSITHPEIFPSLEKICFPFEKSGFMKKEAITILSNLDKEKYKIEEFRKLIVEELKNQDFLQKSSKVTQTVKCAERSGCKLEIIPTKQWYINILNHKEALLKEAKKINWLPQEMFEKIRVWIENLRHDWCISRDRYWGIKIPNNNLQLEEKPQIFDTWFTSSLTPIINTLCDKEFTIETAFEEAKNSLPMDLRPQAHEIIRTWAFCTIVKSYLHFDQIPWKNIMISGWCLARDGGKMSKSKGNIIDPLKLLETFEPDAIRYWSANSSLGSDTRYDENILKVGTKLINKLTNVFKFLERVTTNSLFGSAFAANIPIEDQVGCAMRRNARVSCDIPYDIDLSKITELTDLWIINKFISVVKSTTDYLNKFDYFRALEIAEKFFWSDFCDNYIEICKTRAYGENPEVSDSAHISALMTLAFLIKNLLKIFAIYLPFTTETLYLSLYSDEVSIHRRGNWVDLNELGDRDHYFQGIAAEILIKILEEVRGYKSKRQISIKTKIDLEIYFLKDDLFELFEKVKFDLVSVANIDKLSIIKFVDQSYDCEIKDLCYLKFSMNEF